MSLDCVTKVMEDTESAEVPPRKTRSLPRTLSRENVNPGVMVDYMKGQQLSVASPGGAGGAGRGDREARIAVMGGPGVGKTALVVRFITKRFIGDYAHYETTTSVTTMIDSKPTCLKILDTTGQDTSKRDQYLQWAEGILLVFSVTDPESFNVVQSLTEHLAATCSTNGTTGNSAKRLLLPPIIIVGNKSDLCHIREVPESSAKKLAKRLGCPYRETSASDSYDSVAEAFSCSFHEIQKERRRQSKKHSTSKIAQLKETLRNWTDFRNRTNTF